MKQTGGGLGLTGGPSQPRRTRASAGDVHAGSRKKNIPWRCSIPASRTWQRRPAPCFAITAGAPLTVPPNGRRPRSDKRLSSLISSSRNSQALLLLSTRTRIAPAIPFLFYDQRNTCHGHQQEDKNRHQAPPTGREVDLRRALWVHCQQAAGLRNRPYRGRDRPENFAALRRLPISSQTRASPPLHGGAEPQRSRRGEWHQAIKPARAIVTVHEILGQRLLHRYPPAGKYTRKKINSKEVQQNKLEHIVIEQHHQASLDCRTLATARAL